MRRVQFTVMLDLGTMTDTEIGTLQRDIEKGGYDWAALHGVSQDGEEVEAICSGGFNPIELTVWDGSRAPSC